MERGHKEADLSEATWESVPEGTLWRIVSSRDEAGAPWSATIRWMEGGWTQVVGVEVGPVSGPESGFEFDDAGRTAASTRRGDPLPLAAVTREEAIAAVSAAFHVAEDIRVTQIVAGQVVDPPQLNAIQDGSLADRELTPEERRSHQVKLAAHLYAVYVQKGVPDPTATAARVMGVARATVSRRLQTARRQGLLGPAPSGKAGGLARGHQNEGSSR